MMIVLTLIAIGLAMDSFAASMSAERKGKLRDCLKVALFFGVFQGTMPILGHYITGSFKVFVSSVDHWIAFGILSFIGFKMILDSKKKIRVDIFNTKTLIILSLATSIDALFAGFVLASLGFNILGSGLFIGLVTFVLSFVGVTLSNYFRKSLKKYSVIVGGIILIVIGFKILISHLLGA